MLISYKVFIVTYSKNLRRWIKSLLNSVRDFFELMLFFLIIVFIFALIGYRVLGELDSKELVDTFTNDFEYIGYTMNNLYVLSTTDNYPDIMFPSLKENYQYLLYFIPFMLITIFIVAPIPVAILFNGYKRQRA